jgi:hypothetical protein
MEMITCTSTLTILRTRDDDATLGYNAYMNAFLFTRTLWKLLKMVFSRVYADCSRAWRGKRGERIGSAGSQSSTSSYRHEILMT